MDHLERETLADEARTGSARRRLQLAVSRVLAANIRPRRGPAPGDSAHLGVSAGAAVFARADASPQRWTLRRTAAADGSTRRMARGGSRVLDPFMHFAVEARGGSLQTACGRPGAAVVGSGLKELLRVTCPACRAYCEGCEGRVTRLARWWRKR